MNAGTLPINESDGRTTNKSKHNSGSGLDSWRGLFETNTALGVLEVLSGMRSRVG
jgi:hypothetical protein